MNTHIEHQIIMQNGQPVFVVIPYQDFLRFSGNMEDKVYFPHEVVHSHTIEEKSLARAWREYKGLSQEEMAKRMGISQPAYAQMEKPSARLRLKTRMKIASALGISPDQLTLN
jgi:DNA-binding XRE family transcriptional regulator